MKCEKPSFLQFEVNELAEAAREKKTYIVHSIPYLQIYIR